MLALVSFFPSPHELQLSWKPAWCSYSPSLVFVLMQRIAPGGRVFSDVSQLLHDALSGVGPWSYYQRLRTFATRTAAPGVKNLTGACGARRCLALLHSTAAAAVLHKLCAALLPPTSKSFSRLIPTRPPANFLPDQANGTICQKLNFPTQHLKSLLKFIKKLSLKLLPIFHIFQSSEFWTSYLSQLNLFLGFDFFSALNYNVIQEIGTKVAAFLHDKSTLCMAIARVQATVQIWKQELHTTEFTRNAETEIQERIFSCNFVIFSDMCVPQ